ncbi:unnamed protein product [Caenorhabditis angaria]|uniref:BSD domain-containing protein n=1 Tax=Caenorhabditis angaria TaxID=860376 RepID=A0A9P1IMD5_9PELO|nr:unnamed protein product [Caenorhabditis angaria]
MAEIVVEVTFRCHPKKAGDGKSPIGRLTIFREYVEWRDNASPEVLTLKFIHIKGQRVSPPHKSKVQLQLVLENEEQATFVFLNPAHDKETLAKERDSVKETLQQALISHRARVNQLAASVEKQSIAVELEAKQKILRENKTLEQLYKSLVATKLILPQDFWEDYYKKEGQSEDRIGINGAFLANIAQQEGTNGVKLNLNAEIIQAIFVTYPAVEKKHLELVPHEMTESAFWTKFFQSHYFHRESEVLPNPKDPFADCVKSDEEEMKKLSAEGILRKRFDLDHLDDYGFRDFTYKSESLPKSVRATLIKRCNYLSEKILAISWKDGGAETIAAGTKTNEKQGFAVLNRVVAETENRLESGDLAETSTSEEYQHLKIDEKNVAEIPEYSENEAETYKNTVLRFFQNNSNEKILNPKDMEHEQTMVFEDGLSNGNNKISENVKKAENWEMTNVELGEMREMQNATREICRHFWTSFPPKTPEMEAKLKRMVETLTTYRADKVGKKHTEHCIQMIDLALEKYRQFIDRQK